jgi:3-oxoacyl-[acyl-carrier protein] reductase
VTGDPASRSIAGRVALITGAGSGMGRATAELFAREGARVAVVDLDDAAAVETVERIRSASGHATSWILDVADFASVPRVVDGVTEELGPVDILVNNAGRPSGTPLDADGFEQLWMQSLTVNLAAQAVLARYCLPGLLQSDGGRIVNIASTEGLAASHHLSAYSAAKHGVIGLTRSLAVELGSRGITVNCICPGPIRTAMTAPIAEEAKAKFARRRVPLQRYGEASEVAHAVLSLALPAMSYVNGAVLPVDGGMTAKADLG